MPKGGVNITGKLLLTCSISICCCASCSSCSAVFRERSRRLRSADSLMLPSSDFSFWRSTYRQEGYFSNVNAARRSRRRSVPHLVQRVPQCVLVLLQPHRLPLRVFLLRLQHGDSPLQAAQPLLHGGPLRLGGLDAAPRLREARRALTQSLTEERIAWFIVVLLQNLVFFLLLCIKTKCQPPPGSCWAQTPVLPAAARSDSAQPAGSAGARWEPPRFSLLLPTLLELHPFVPKQSEAIITHTHTHTKLNPLSHTHLQHPSALFRRAQRLLQGEQTSLRAAVGRRHLLQGLAQRHGLLSDGRFSFLTSEQSLVQPVHLSLQHRNTGVALSDLEFTENRLRFQTAEQTRIIS